MAQTKKKQLHWAVELHERFLSFVKEGRRISNECKESQHISKNIYAAMADQAGRCADDLYLWAPSKIKKMIRENEGNKP